jgi:hypothetical protein
MLMNPPLLSIPALCAAAMLAPRLQAQHDDCSGAIPVAQGLNGPFTNVGSTTSLPPWPCGAGALDVWFVYVAPAAGQLAVDTCTGTTYDSTLEVFDGSGGCGALLSLACNDDSCGYQSAVTVPVVAGGVYYLRVGGYAADTGTFSLAVNGPIGSGTVATNTPIGAGCLRRYASVYELFPSSAAFDLDNTAMTFLPTGSGGYVIVPAGSLLPVGSVATPTTLALADDDEVVVPFTVGSFPGSTGLAICDNGFVSLATGNTVDYQPDPAVMLNEPVAAFWSWHDLNPTEPGSGPVRYEEAPGLVVVTFDGVYTWGGTSASDANTIQFQFHATGQVTIAWGAMATGAPEHLLGYSPGGPSLDPGSIDLGAMATASALELTGIDTPPLTLTGVTRPVIGTQWTLQVANIPPTGVLGVDVMGLADAGFADLGFLGAPGCGLRATLDVLFGWAVTGPTHTFGGMLPSSPSIVGMHVFTTSAVFQNPPLNAFGAITANGIDARVGDT